MKNGEHQPSYVALLLPAPPAGPAPGQPRLGSGAVEVVRGHGAADAVPDRDHSDQGADQGPGQGPGRRATAGGGCGRGHPTGEECDEPVLQVAGRRPGEGVRAWPQRGDDVLRVPGRFGSAGLADLSGELLEPSAHGLHLGAGLPQLGVESLVAAGGRTCQQRPRDERPGEEQRAAERGLQHDGTHGRGPYLAAADGSVPVEEPSSGASATPPAPRTWARRRSQRSFTAASAPRDVGR